jgi:tetratricopeptide (TPR) repeat protein
MSVFYADRFLPLSAFVRARHLLKLTALLSSWIILVVVISGCASGVAKRKITGEETKRQKQVSSPAEHLVPLADRIDPRAYSYFVNATLYEQMGYAYRAALNYKRALKIYPDSYPIRYSLAVNLYRIQEFRDALKTLETIDPEDVPVYDLRGALYRALGVEDSALIAYLNVVRLDSNNTSAYSYLAGIYRKQNKIDSVIWAYQNLTRIRPNNHRLWIELAKLQAQQKDFESAKQSLWNAISHGGDRTGINAYIGLSELYQELEQPDSALAALKQALEVEPDNILIHQNLSNLYIHLDSLTLAIPHVRKEVELAPLDRTAVRRLAMLYYWVDSLETADSIFTDLIRNGDRNPLNHSYLGRIAYRREDFSRAREQFQIVTQLADTVYESWLDLGVAYRRLGQPEQEIQTYLTGLDHMRDEPSRLRLMFALGAAYERQGRIDESISTFEEIIARDPDYAQALNYLGYMLADRGMRLEYAHDLIERAVHLAPDNAAFLDSYGWVFYRLGEYEEALVHLKKAVELDDDPVIFDHLGDVYQAVGDLEQARAWWRKALQMDPDNEQIKQKLDRQP